MLCEIKGDWNFNIFSMRLFMNWLVGGALPWDFDAWDNMWNVVSERVSREALGWCG